MKREGYKTILSASDLMRFQGCRHATTLDLTWLRQGRRANAELAAPAEDDAGAKLIQAKGIAHEKAFLEELKSEGLSIAEIETKEASFAVAHAATVEALKAGKGVIYQAALCGGSWAGYADFLERVERPSNLGPFSYEVLDTKLKRTAAPSHVLQLGLYSDLLAAVQGPLPEHIHVKLGDGERATLRLADYIHYVRRLRQRLEAFVSSPQSTRPEPASACDLCRWSEHCAGEWERTDSLTLVAGIRGDQRRKLEAAGVTTMAALGRRTKSVTGLAPDMLARLAAQASLQHARRQGGPPTFVLRETVEDGKGLSRMPKPNKGDLFFDMEGDPLMEGGLEYLFGIYDEADGEPRFRDYWAHDAEQERQATRDVLDLFTQHLAQHPDAYIYHYNHYEVTALKRLACKHGVGETMLDELLRDKRFVDLYRVVSQGVIASEPSYSLKDMEAFYADKRTEDVTNAADSIVVYEEWRETQDPVLLEGIRAYNEFDCRSTMGLRDWLVRDVRPNGMPWAKLKRTAEERRVKADEIAADDAMREAQRKLISRVKGALAGGPAELLFELTLFHAREDKPRWWAMFDKAEWETADLVEDLDSLAGLTAIGKPQPEKQSLVRTYRFPEQETKLADGAQVKARIEGLPTVTLTCLDIEKQIADVKFGPSAGEPPNALDLIPGGPIGNEVLRDAVARVAEDAFNGKGSYPALEAILARVAPRLKGYKSGAPIIADGRDLVAGTVDAIGRMMNTCLPIQGPPGTGKTYVASHAILALLQSGKRVGVTAHSHKAIDNLLAEVGKRAAEAGFRLKAIKKNSEAVEPPHPSIETTTNSKDARLGRYPLVAGTSWLFAREEHDRKFDYLIVDEAGQFALANIVAAGTAAQNIVLVGDPMQLAQPIQGVHPGQSGASALGYLLGDASTIPPERGVFLPVSRRMHPAICRYISDIAYDGRLTSDGDAARQLLVLDDKASGFAQAGLHFWGIEHEGNSQSSPEEAKAVMQAFEALQGQKFIDRKSKERRISIDDILVVAPYNAQVNLLRRTLPDGARVGTVDKFQGQEAPVCIVSMATSSGEELPRNIEFLFSVNRLNVAISRAQALSIVIASPRLLDVECKTIEQMRLVNALCAVAEYRCVPHLE